MTEGEAADRLALDFLRGLSLEDRVLLDVRDELYGGAWAELESDLRARLVGKPHIFRLMTKIEEDLERLKTLREFEAAHGVDLGAVKNRLERERRAAQGAGAEREDGATEDGAGAAERDEHEAGEAGSGGTTV